MMMTVDPLKDVRSAFQALHKTIGEQRDLQPPEGVAAVLEECSAKLGPLDQRLAQAAMEWDDRRKTVERLSPAENVPQLVQLQGEGASAVRDVLSDVKSAIDSIAARVNGIASGGEAGTREMVVASLLRGNLSGVSDKISVLAEAAAANDLATNFKLETFDRQLRGLRTRSADRRESVRREVEQSAQQTAQRDYEQQIRDLGEQVRELERHRDELTGAMGAKVSELRGLEEKMQEFRGLRAELTAREDAAARIQSRISELEAGKPDIPADVLKLGPIETVQVSGDGRVRRAVLSAAGAAGITLLGCLLMIAGTGGGKTQP
jgi:DNA repair exonuclease SbcCD ATPase subunit